jgi:hypothetical protein
MVLDSNVDPTRVFYRANLDQDLAFQRNVELWFEWVAQHDDAYHLGTSGRAVEKAWYAAQRALRDAPAGDVVGPDEWTDIFLATGYSQGVWPSLAKLWSDWSAGGDAAPVVAEYQSANTPGDDNLFAVYNAVQCTDAVWPSRWSKWRSDNWAVFRDAPFETWANAWFNAPCFFWPANASQSVHVDGAEVAPIMLVGETLDAATPFSGTMEVRRRFPNASVIATSGGTTHGNSLNGNACVDDRIVAYLTDGTLPPRVDGDQPDVTCAALPPPEPQAEAPAATVYSTDQRDLHREILQLLMHRKGH